MWKLLAPANRKEMWLSAGRPLGFTAAKCPSGALGLDPNQEQLGKRAICQSNQIISNPRAGTGLCLVLLPPFHRPCDRFMMPPVCSPVYAVN